MMKGAIDDGLLGYQPTWLEPRTRARLRARCRFAGTWTPRCASLPGPARARGND